MKPRKGKGRSKKKHKVQIVTFSFGKKTDFFFLFFEKRRFVNLKFGHVGCFPLNHLQNKLPNW